MQDRRTYSDEVKVEALKMIKEQGLTLAEVGKRLSIPRGTTGNWVAGDEVSWGSSPISRRFLQPVRKIPPNQYL